MSIQSLAPARRKSFLDHVAEENEICQYSEEPQPPTIKHVRIMSMKREREKMRDEAVALEAKSSAGVGEQVSRANCMANICSLLPRLLGGRQDATGAILPILLQFLWRRRQAA